MIPRAGALALAFWVGYIIGYRKRENNEYRERFRQVYTHWPNDKGRGGGFWGEQRLR